MHVEQLVGLTVVYNTSTLVEGFVLGAAFGLLGYFLSERYRRVRGVTPWRMPSGVWAALLFLFSLIGMVVYLIVVLDDADKDRAHALGGRCPALGTGPARVPGPSSGGLERTCSRPVGPWRASGMGCAVPRRIGSADAGLPRGATTGGLGGSSSAGNRVSGVHGADSARCGPGSGTARTATAASAVVAPGSRWAS